MAIGHGKRISSRVASRRALLVLVVVMTAMTGLYLTFAGQAAKTSTQATGSLTAPTRIVDDTAADGDNAVQSGEAATAPLAEPTTDPSLTCPPYPEFPDARCTGWRHTGVTLAPYNGPSEITVDGTVIDGKDIATCLDIRASDVTIRRSRIRAGSLCGGDAGGHVVAIHSGAKGFLIEDAEIDGLNLNPAGDALARGFVARRVNIHGVGTGVNMWEPAVLEDSYIHDLHFGTCPSWTWCGGGGSHNDGVVSNGGSGFLIRHNNIEVAGTQTAAIALYGDFAPVHNVLVEKNLLSGGGYTVYGGSLTGKRFPVGTRIRFLDNHFSTKFFPYSGYYHAVAYFNPAHDGNLWTGNRWHESGLPLSP